MTTALAVLEKPETETIAPEVATTGSLAALVEFRAKKPSYSHAIIVGVGGNYFYARPYLEMRLRDITHLSFVDPDILEAKNLDRQWSGRTPGRPKVDLAMDEWPNKETQLYGEIGRLEKAHPKELMQGERGTGVLVICLPDNDRARLQASELAEKILEENLATHVGVVVAGTDIGFGQAYWGLCVKEYAGGNRPLVVSTWLHDWRTLHVETGDVEDTGDKTPVGCGQRHMDNYMTGIVIAQAMDELLGTAPTIHEHYWGTLKGTTLKTWAKPVAE